MTPKEPQTQTIRVYIAGPYTHGDTILNVRRAIDMADRLLMQGFIPYLPHTTALWHLVSPKPLEDWYRIDIEWLAKCDALIRLPGKSDGADAEIKYALEAGIPVYFHLEHLVKALDNGEFDG
jgi:nucleoside 2-deoxyribosyltransferase